MDQEIDLEILPLFNTTIIFMTDNKITKKLYENYKNCNVDEWKNIFYNNINIK